MPTVHSLRRQRCRNQGLGAQHRVWTECLVRPQVSQGSSTRTAPRNDFSRQLERTHPRIPDCFCRVASVAVAMVSSGDVCKQLGRLHPATHRSTFSIMRKRNPHCRYCSGFGSVQDSTSHRPHRHRFLRIFKSFCDRRPHYRPLTKARQNFKQR